MIVRWIDERGVRDCDVDELPDLLKAEAGFVWVDIPHLEAQAQQIMLETFGFHPRAVQDCLERNHVPKTHVYADHVLVVAHAPESGHAGHVHYLELDQLIGRNYLVTTHGPVNPTVASEACLRETEAVARRLTTGRLRASTPMPCPTRS